jgi:diamine N-acetyltransferase
VRDGRRITIRTGRPADAGMLAALGAQTFTDAYAGDVPAGALAAFVSAEFSPQVQAGELADEAGRFFIAEAGGEPVAYAYVREVPGESGAVLELARIYARPDWIGQGVGRMLMGACVQEAVRRGVGTIRLTVWTENARAIAFYRRMGFVEVGREPFQLGSEAQVDLILERPVPAGQPTAGR